MIVLSKTLHSFKHTLISLTHLLIQSVIQQTSAYFGERRGTPKNDEGYMVEQDTVLGSKISFWVNIYTLK